MKGFTLLEVMVALAILAGTVLTVLGAVNYHLSLVAEDREHTIALLLARSKIEELELAAPKGAMPEKQGTFAPEQPDMAWRAEVSSMSAPIFRKLTVTVAWGADGRTLSLEDYLLQ